MIACYPGYKTPSGDSRVTTECVNGAWNLSMFTNLKDNTNPTGSSAAVTVGVSVGVAVGATVGVPRCEPVCKEGCENNGTCVAPDTCACPAAFGGDRCQARHCNGAPTKIKNSIMIFR